MKITVCDRPGCDYFQRDHLDFEHGEITVAKRGESKRGVGRHHVVDLCMDCRKELEKWWRSKVPDE